MPTEGKQRRATRDDDAQEQGVNVRERMKVLKIRLPQELYDEIDSASRELKLSKAEVIRKLTHNNLQFSSCSYINEQQGEQLRVLLHDALCEMNSIKTELRRIGVNYNQELRLKNEIFKLEQAQGKAMKNNDLNAYYEYGRRAQELRSQLQYGKSGYTVNDIEPLIERYEQATKKVGEQLCRILE